jgi:glycosyltransferase involved in cell wall biosynthesis
MEKKSLIIINNEKVFKEDGQFYCDNFDMKATPETLSNYYSVEFIVRNSKKKGENKLNLKNIKIGSNIFSFIRHIYKTFKTPNSQYLLITINPYTFISSLILFLFRKKTYVYLMSSGYDEWKHILGTWSVWIYHLMFVFITKNSKVISCNPRLYEKKKSFLVQPSRLTSEWLTNHKEPPLDKVKLLYVGRINPEKGIYNFIGLFNKINFNAEFSIVGYKKNLNNKNKNIKLLGYCSEQHLLRDIYDNHNIMILPSYTEAHPYVVDECLARKRPIIIFEEISYIVNNRKGIFVIKRNLESFTNTVNYIMNNYKNIQKRMEDNSLPTKEIFFKEFAEIFNK